MCRLFNKVSDPLRVRRTLDFFAADTNYMNISLHIYVYYRKQNSDMSTTKCKIEFFTVLQSLCTAKKTKCKSGIFIYTFSRNICLNF